MTPKTEEARLTQTQTCPEPWTSSLSLSLPDLTPYNRLRRRGRCPTLQKAPGQDAGWFLLDSNPADFPGAQASRRWSKHDLVQGRVRPRDQFSLSMINQLHHMTLNLTDGSSLDGDHLVLHIYFVDSSVIHHSCSNIIQIDRRHSSTLRNAKPVV